MAISRASKSSIQQAFPKQQTIWDQTSSVAGMDALAVTTLTAATSTITFTGIPATYTHLQLRGVARTTNSGTALVALNTYFNGDTTAGNYWSHQLYGTGASTAGIDGVNNPSYFFVANNNGMLANDFSAFSIDIFDYTNTNKSKTGRCLSGGDGNNTNGFINLGGLYWANTAAITSISFTITNGSNFNTNTSFALYGVK
jgi:hypothetical protein